MKTTHIVPLAALAVLLLGANLHAQIYETNTAANTIGEYNFNGTPIGTGTLVSTGLDDPWGIAVSGSDIFVANAGANTIQEYTTAGAPVGSGTLITGLSGPVGIAISGTDIFVTNYNAGTIREFNTAGAPVGSGTLVSGLDGPAGIAVSGGDIFVTNSLNNTITEYTTAGAPVGSGTLVAVGQGNPVGIAVSGGDIYVTNAISGTSDMIAEYNMAGALVNTGSAGLYDPTGIAAYGSNFILVNSSGNTIDGYTFSGSSHVTGTLTAVNGGWGIALGGAFEPGAVTPTSQTTSVAANTNYAASVAPFTATGGYGTTATIAGGTASTTSNVTVGFFGAGGEYSNVASDIVTVSGMPNKGTGPAGQIYTDTFVLEVSFNPSAANALGGASSLILLWRNPSTGQWVNAVDGNNGGTPFYAGDTAYASQYFELGDYGVDTADGYSWAVVDHNSDFVVGNLDEAPELVPEPSTWAMLAMGGAALLFAARRCRAKACARIS